MTTGSRLSVLLSATVPATLAAALLAGCGAAAAPAGAPVAAPVPVAPAVAAVAAPSHSVVAHRAAATTAAVGKRATKRADIWTGKVRAYGDSVMLGAKPALQRRLNAYVNADVSRQSYTLLSIVRSDWSRGRIRGPVVIHTGTNGTVVKKDLKRTIRPIQKRHAVLLVNAKVNRSWVPGNNAVLSQVDRKWRNVIQLDWHKIASKHPSWLSGYHLNSSGAKKYANLVAKKLGR